MNNQKNLFFFGTKEGNNQFNYRGKQLSLKSQKSQHEKSNCLKKEKYLMPYSF